MCSHSFFQLLLFKKHRNIFRQSYHFSQVVVGKRQVTQRCFYIIMPRQLLNHNHINVFLYKMGGGSFCLQLCSALLLFIHLCQPPHTHSVRKLFTALTAALMD